MDLTGAHERSVQIPGNGYVETRQFYFSPRGEFRGAFITVVDRWDHVASGRQQ